MRSVLLVPPIRQPDDMSCLPTRVRSVLAFWGRRVSDDDAAAMCHTLAWGTVVDFALGALADAGVDADLQQFDSLDDLQDVLSSGQPVIVMLRHPGGGFHAVVACDVAIDGVTIMDPDPGDYKSIPRHEFETLWCRVQNEGLLVGSRRLSSSSRR